MSKKKSGGKLKQQKRVQAKYRGVKVTDGQKVSPGMILVRQLGTKFRAGKGVEVSKDFSLYSISEGVVKFGQRLGKKTISVLDK